MSSESNYDLDDVLDNLPLRLRNSVLEEMRGEKVPVRQREEPDVDYNLVAKIHSQHLDRTNRARLASERRWASLGPVPSTDSYKAREGNHARQGGKPEPTNVQGAVIVGTLTTLSGMVAVVAPVELAMVPLLAAVTYLYWRTAKKW